MDAITLGTAILGGGLVASTITQISKRWIPDAWRPIFAAVVAVAVGAVAVALVGGFQGSTWPAAIAAVYGAAQGLYVVTYQLAMRTSVEGTVTSVTDTPLPSVPAQLVAEAASAPTQEA